MVRSYVVSGLRKSNRSKGTRDAFDPPVAARRSDPDHHPDSAVALRQTRSSSSSTDHRDQERLAISLALPDAGLPIDHDLPGLNLEDVVAGDAGVRCKPGSQCSSITRPMRKPLNCASIIQLSRASSAIEGKDFGSRRTRASSQLVESSTPPERGRRPTFRTIRGGSFKGRQLHTKDYRIAEEFAGKHVVVVGAGISAIQLLDSLRFPASPRLRGSPAGSRNSATAPSRPK